MIHNLKRQKISIGITWQEVLLTMWNTTGQTLTKDS